MCKRTCPECKSTAHTETFGILGATILCEGCGLVLAWRADPDAAPAALTEEQAEAWAAERRGVRLGAEAENPADDFLWIGPTFLPPPPGADA